MSKSKILLSLWFCAVGFADVGDDSVESATQAQLHKLNPFENVGHSFAPVVGYEPTFGVVGGGAYFFSSPTFRYGIDANTNLGGVFQLHANTHHSFADRWEYGFRGGLIRGFDPYFGEGGETLASNFVRLWGLQTSAKVHVAYKPGTLYSVGIFADFRQRDENSDRNNGVRRFAAERGTALGIFHKIDTRIDKDNSKEGFVLGTTLSVVPGFLDGRETPRPFGQLEADFIVYKEVLEEVMKGVVSAFRLMGGMSFGQPSYAFAYRLGGSDRLVGYLENRFRGSKYYLQQTELRFPIWEMFSGAAFLGFGDITTNDFTNPKMAYGAGLRIGLPPSYVSKVRIDFGFGRDQAGVFADFGQTF